MRLTRAGVILPELVVGLTLTAALAGLVLGTLGFLQRMTQAQAERGEARAGLATAAQLTRTELRDLSAGEADLLVLGPDQVVYRARRATARACGMTAAGVLLRSGTYRALRLPVPARDTLEILLPDSLSGAPAWIRSGIIGAPGIAFCPDGDPALSVPVDLLLSTGVPDGVPVLTWEVMELRAYASGGETWLGVRSVSAGETIQPLLGPLESGPPVFRYLDPAGIATADASRVARVVVTVRARRDPMMAVGGAARAARTGVDSTEVAIYLPNGAAP